MPKVRMVLFVTVLSTCFLAASSFAADVAKIGLVDLQRVLEVSSAGKAAQGEIKQRKDEMEKDLKEKGASIEESIKKLERDAMVMNADVREKKQRDIEIMKYDFKRLKDRYREELQKLQTQVLIKIQGEITDLLQDIGKKEGFLMILEKHEAGVFYSPKVNDITDKVIKQYNVRYAKASK